MKKNWDRSESWYSGCVGEKGHYYHQTVVLPKLVPLLGKMTSLLDLGCGQGVLARHLAKEIEYVGIDNSKALINEANRLSKGMFLVSDATKPLELKKRDFDCATFVLSLQNMEDGKGAIQVASDHLKVKGKLVIVLNHPCFRIPRQSDWGIDENKKEQFRKISRYMSPLEIPIQTNPSKGGESETTFSYHHPLGDYFSWLWHGGFVVDRVEEWCSDKKSEGKQAKMEDRARKEIPLFMAIRAVKEK